MHKIAIIASLKDSAGVNIRNNLIGLFNPEKTGEKFDNNDVFDHNKIPDKNIKLYLTNDELIFSENIDKRIDADFLIFASRHRSKENKPSFTVHPIGNWNKADFGGKEKALCPSSAFLLKSLFIELNKNSFLFSKETNFQVTMEATHHGPYVEKPAVFVEIGSTDKEWEDSQNGEIIARTIMNALEMFKVPEHENGWVSALLLGGGHYAQAGNKAMLSTNYAIGHICPKYLLEHITEDILLQAVERITPKPSVILLDWKGLGQCKQKISALLDNTGMRYERI